MPTPARCLVIALLVAPGRLATAARLPPETSAAQDSCVPYWEVVEAKCDAAKVAAKARYCDPVHERVTLAALRILSIGENANDPTVREYLAGVRWSDDPIGLLNDDAGNPTQAVRWCKAFVAAQADALAGRSARSLLGRSHFGDLQLFHSMATRPGRTSQETYDETQPWLELAYRVATGELSGKAKLGSVPVSHLGSKLTGLRGQTINAFFGVGEHGDVKARAVGVLLHYLQDSVGDGHAARARGASPPITHYFTYARTKHALHGGDTGWRSAWPPDAPLESWAGSLRAIQVSVDLIRLVQHRQPWSEAQKHIEAVAGSFTALDAKAVTWRAR